MSSVKRLLQARRTWAIRADDLARLNVALKKVLPFITVPGAAAGKGLDAAGLAAQLRPQPRQGSLFDTITSPADG